MIPIVGATAKLLSDTLPGHVLVLFDGKVPALALKAHRANDPNAGGVIVMQSPAPPMFVPLATDPGCINLGPVEIRVLGLPAFSNVGANTAGCLRVRDNLLGMLCPFGSSTEFADIASGIITPTGTPKSACDVTAWKLGVVSSGQFHQLYEWPPGASVP